MLEIKSAEFETSVFNIADFRGRNLPEIAFAGRSNVGKSAMLNCLLGHRGLARVSRTPGKTRALNYFLINNKYYFVDLPGYGYARIAQSRRQEWGQLMADYFARAQHLCAVVQLLDSRHEPTALDLQMLDLLAERGLDYLIVLTKSDKLSASRQALAKKNILHKLALPESERVILFSALKGVGKKAVLSWIEGIFKTCRG